MTDILSVLSLLGIGSILGGVITHWLGKTKELEFKKLEQKERRYKCSILYMYAYIEPSKIRTITYKNPDIKTAEDIFSTLETEYYDMLLFASKEVIELVKKFIINPDRNNYFKAVLAMRRDLWDKKSNFEINDVKIEGLNKLRNKSNKKVDSSE